MSTLPKVIDSVVNNDLCIGCGLCVYKCPSNALKMHWNDYGFLIPELKGKCDSNGDCLSVCPFNPFPKEEVKTENELAQLYLNESTQFNNQIGKYINIYAGHSKEFRLTSSSGGIATYVLVELLEKGIVDHIISVKESETPGVYYEYSLNSNREELLSASKTRYFPVSLAEILTKIHTLKGKVAVVGIACFIKAIRLAQFSEPVLKDKIPFLVGIICGGVKSRFFTEYLASKAGVEKENILKPQFRIKDVTSSAPDYSFGCYDGNKNNEKKLKMRSVVDMWGTGLFKANACDFCDDVATELADISLGDAWIKPYNEDGKGTNVIITRSSIADDIINEGIKSKKLEIEGLSLEHFLTSQQGGFNHRQTGLSVRLKKSKKQNIPIPPKRFLSSKVNTIFIITQILRMKTRRKSLEAWKNSPSAKSFDKKMKNHLTFLRMITLLGHYKRQIAKYF